MKFSEYVFLMFSISLVLYMMGAGPIMDIRTGGDLNNTLGNSTINRNISYSPTNPQCGDLLSVMKSAVGLGNSPQVQEECKQSASGFVISQILVILASAAIMILSGFSAMFLIPIIILIVILNFFVFPLNFLFGVADPSSAWLMTPLIIFFNAMTVLAIVSAIKGDI